MKWLTKLVAVMVFGFSMSAMAMGDDEEVVFKDAIDNGNLKVIQNFIKDDASITNQKFFGWSSLQMAVNKNQMEIVKFLLSKGADINYVHPNSHHNAFHLAVFKNYKEMATFLAKNGANVNQKLMGDVSLVRYFTDEGDTNMVKFLTDLGVKADGCQEKCF